MLSPAGKHPLVVPRINEVTRYGIKHLRPVMHSAIVPQKIMQPVAPPDRGPERHLHVVVAPCASPGCPSPGVVIVREVIAVRGTLAPKLEVIARNDHHPRVVAVVIQQRFAEWKKR